MVVAFLLQISVSNAKVPIKQILKLNNQNFIRDLEQFFDESPTNTTNEDIINNNSSDTNTENLGNSEYVNNTNSTTSIEEGKTIDQNQTNNTSENNNDTVNQTYTDGNNQENNSTEQQNTKDNNGNSNQNQTQSQSYQTIEISFYKKNDSSQFQGSLSLGSQKQEIPFIIDFSQTQSFIYVLNCSEENCIQTQFNALSSTTYQQNILTEQCSEIENCEYIEGIDQLTIDNMTLNNFAFYVLETQNTTNQISTLGVGKLDQDSNNSSIISQLYNNGIIQYKLVQIEMNDTSVKLLIGQNLTNNQNYSNDWYNNSLSDNWGFNFTGFSIGEYIITNYTYSAYFDINTKNLQIPITEYNSIVNYLNTSFNCSIDDIVNHTYCECDRQTLYTEFDDIFLDTDVYEQSIVTATSMVHTISTIKEESANSDNNISQTSGEDSENTSNSSDTSSSNSEGINQNYTESNNNNSSNQNENNGTQDSDTQEEEQLVQHDNTTESNNATKNSQQNNNNTSGNSIDNNVGQENSSNSSNSTTTKIKRVKSNKKLSNLFLNSTQYLQYDQENGKCKLMIDKRDDLVNEWILGISFMKEYQTILDYESSQIGLIRLYQTNNIDNSTNDQHQENNAQQSIIFPWYYIIIGVAALGLITLLFVAYFITRKKVDKSVIYKINIISAQPDFIYIKKVKPFFAKIQYYAVSQDSDIIHQETIDLEYSQEQSYLECTQQHLLLKSVEDTFNYSSYQTMNTQNQTTAQNNTTTVNDLPPILTNVQIQPMTYEDDDIQQNDIQVTDDESCDRFSKQQTVLTKKKTFKQKEVIEELIYENKQEQNEVIVAIVKKKSTINKKKQKIGIFQPEKAETNEVLKKQESVKKQSSISSSTRSLLQTPKINKQQNLEYILDIQEDLNEEKIENNQQITPKNDSNFDYLLYNPSDEKVKYKQINEDSYHTQSNITMTPTDQDLRNLTPSLIDNSSSKMFTPSIYNPVETSAIDQCVAEIVNNQEIKIPVIRLSKGRYLVGSEVVYPVYKWKSVVLRQNGGVFIGMEKQIQKNQEYQQVKIQMMMDEKRWTYKKVLKDLLSRNIKNKKKVAKIMKINKVWIDRQSQFYIQPETETKLFDLNFYN